MRSTTTVLKSSRHSLRELKSALLLLVSLGALALLASACAVRSDSEPEPTKETIYFVDAVKLISSSVARGDDPKTFGQRSYTISGNSRLLLRYESLTAAKPRILADKPVRIRIFVLPGTDIAAARASLRICPIMRDWMMAATWAWAHPYKSGAWPAGGELETEDCVAAETTAALERAKAAARAGTPESSRPTSATATQPTTQPSHSSSSVALEATPAPAPTDPSGIGCLDQNALCFDVSAWYNNYVVQRETNFGLAVISVDGKSTRIYGDGSGSKGPRIHWIEPSYPTYKPIVWSER